MTFKVNTAALVTYMATLRGLHKDVETAENYVRRHGDLSFHESGLIGLLFGSHADIMKQLTDLHDKLENNLWKSSDTMLELANEYDAIDASAAAKIDSTYPASPRAIPSRD